MSLSKRLYRVIVRETSSWETSLPAEDPVKAMNLAVERLATDSKQFKLISENTDVVLIEEVCS